MAVVSQFVLASSGRHPNWREAVTQPAGVMTFPPPLCLPPATVLDSSGANAYPSMGSDGTIFPFQTAETLRTYQKSIKYPTCLYFLEGGWVGE